MGDIEGLQRRSSNDDSRVYMKGKIDHYMLSVWWAPFVMKIQHFQLSKLTNKCWLPRAQVGTIPAICT